MTRFQPYLMPLSTGVRGRIVLRTSALRSSTKFAKKVLKYGHLTDGVRGATPDTLVADITKRQTRREAGTQNLWTSPTRAERGSRVTEWGPLHALDNSPKQRSSAGRSLTMISIRVQKRHGTVTVHSRVTAPSIERALEVAGEGAKVVFPIEGEEFFAFAKGNVSATENLSWNVA
jgi:hypothetical protein